VSLFSGQHNPGQAERVVVTTYNRLGAGAIAPERRDIYLAASPAELFANYQDAGIEGLKHLDRARCYGLLATGTPLAPQQRALLLALFGTEAVHVPQHGHHPLPVDVAFTRLEGGQRPPHHRADFLLKRLGLWQHHLRNRRLARLFELLASRARRERWLVTHQFAELYSHVRERMGGRVGLLVEGLEHGLALAELLPCVPLVAGAATWTEGLSGEQLQALKLAKGPRKTTAPVIVTYSGLKDAGTFDILVRADGGTGLPPLPVPWLAVPNGHDRRLLLVDADDRHHPVLRRWSRERRLAYRAAGWTVAGEPRPSPLDQLLACQQEGCS